MKNFSHRDSGREIMDDLDFSDPVLFQTLRELKVINRWLGGNQVTIQAFKKLLKTNLQQDTKISIADLGSGSGDMLVQILQWLDKRNNQCDLIGIDANQHIIEFAKENTKAFQNIKYLHADVFSPEFDQYHFDFVTCTLFVHHFSDSQLVNLLERLKKQTKKAIVINDLHRHWLAYYSIKLLTSIFSRSYMVKYDAPLSVARSFRRKDWVRLFDEAGIVNYKIKWKWAFRWQVVISLE